MNRFHNSVQVVDLHANTRSYSRLVRALPSVRQAACAKWLIDDPAVSFPILAGKSEKIGISRLGAQASDEAGLSNSGERLRAADAIALAQAGTTCWHARSHKHLAVNPQGMPWETFHTRSEAASCRAGLAGASVQRAHGCSSNPATFQDDGACASTSTVPADEQIVPAGRSTRRG